MKYEITVNGTMRLVEVEATREGSFRVAFDGVTHVVDLTRPTPEAFQMLIDGASWEAGAVSEEGGWMVDVMGFTTSVEVVDPRRKALKMAAGTHGGTVSTQMPGRVVRILVQPGEIVKKGQPLLVVEAMKMENEMKTPMDGTVAAILVTEGQTVETGAKLVRIE
ncbi:acetyl-CoA carboxylase biotin carboxyl carrier protein subunit [Deltaproteobacteria bacterium]|nr:acetyl-CoA carboxylase biotin carboxyl carrier protein subunit [Deltaproteobacteria bacterium]